MRDTDIAIHIATPGDYEGIKAIASQIYEYHAKARPDIFKEGADPFPEEQFKQYLAEESKYRLYVARDAVGGVCAYLFVVIQAIRDSPVKQDTRDYFVDTIAVHESRQGQGIGSRMMEHLRKVARLDKVDRITLNVWAFNERAIEFYRKEGMRIQTVRMELEP